MVSDGAEARYLMKGLVEMFAFDFLGGYDAYRYLQPEGYDLLLKSRAKGRGDNISMTIGILYKAMRAQRWNT